MDYSGNVTVKIDGLAASAASVIAMAGYHSAHVPGRHDDDPQPRHHAIGDAGEMKKAIDMLSEVKRVS